MTFENTLKEWYISDLQKKPIDKFDRAALIRSYIDDNGLSVRSFAKKFGIHRSTVEDWLLYNRISEKQYNKLISEGKGYREIYKALRSNKTDKFVYSDIDAYLLEIKPKLNGFRTKVMPTAKTFVLIDETIEVLKNLSVELNLRQRKKK